VVRYRLDVASRRLSNATEVLNVKDRLGFPDGMTDGGDGSVIIAFYNPILSARAGPFASI